jgi:hypothetical protein
MKLLLTTLITFALLVNTENNEGNNIAEEATSTISYFETGANANFEVGEPFYLDVDKDGISDFLFHTVSIYDEGVLRTKYMVRGLNNNEVLAASGHAAITEDGETVGAKPAYNNLSWSDSHAQILESVNDDNGQSYTGTWSGDRSQYIGFKLVKESKTFYGYAEVTIDPVNEKASVPGYGINRAPWQGIQI